MVGWIILVVVIVVVLWFVGTYNMFVTLRNRVKNAWAQIDVQLKRRYDLIPNLVETVKGYAAHEKEVFEKVTELRTRAMSASGPKEVGETNNMLTGALKTLFAVAEAYPELKANENFLKLQEELTNTENQIAFSRQFYNDIVMRYNMAQEKIPAALVAKVMGLTPSEYYPVPEEERGSVKVSF
ncbi:MAG TPA: LemA family protein [Caldisericia bacterium]|nr:LemA family protein [Caldisericia bacterium]HPB33709.1 LemA family protein [Caldisericia bacterium]HQL66391.1 LemA family protein [Caldisericia bacterium]HQN47862.1 LemA family protein [Caldisericia bacterium]HQO99446.1 LemA family protein [Caldisericia bacterium]